MGLGKQRQGRPSRPPRSFVRRLADASIRVGAVLLLAPMLAYCGLLLFWQQAWPSPWHGRDYLAAVGDDARADEAAVGQRLGGDYPPTGLWHLRSVRAQQAWAALERRERHPVRVGLWDGVIDPTHPDLALGLVAAQGEDDGRYAARWLMGDGHGTALWGVIAGRGLPGMTGVSPTAQMLVTGTHTDRRDQSVGASLSWFAKQGVRVANYSIAAPAPVVTQREVDDAYAAGVLLVTGLPNSNSDASAHPAAMRGTLAVSGVNQHDEPAGHGWGPLLDVTAPASWPLSTAPRLWLGPLQIGGPYRATCCNSVAVAVTTGVASLVASADPTLTSAQIEKRLKLSARKPMGMEGARWHPRYGYGVVDAYAAVTYDTTGPAIAQVSAERAGDAVLLRGGVIDETNDDRLLAGRERDRHLLGVPVSNIARVEARLDDGPWVPATLNAPAEPPGPHARRFDARLSGSGPVWLRAWDTAGNVGPEVRVEGP